MYLISNKEKNTGIFIIYSPYNQESTIAFHIKIRDYLVGPQTQASNKRQLWRNKKMIDMKF